MAILLALKMEGYQDRQPLEAEKKQGNGFSSRVSRKESSPCQHLDFSDLQNCKTITLSCFEALSL